MCVLHAGAELPPLAVTDTVWKSSELHTSLINKTLSAGNQLKPNPAASLFRIACIVNKRDYIYYNNHL
jgi:hypothetical protein